MKAPADMARYLGEFAGAGLINIAANKQEQFEILCRLLACAHLIEDPRFRHREARKTNRAELTALLETALVERTAEAWEMLLNEAGVPAGRVLDLPDVLAHPHVVHRGITQKFDTVDGLDGPVTIVRAGFKVTGRQAEVANPPPGLGQHTDELLGEVGYDAAAIATLRAEGTI